MQYEADYLPIVGPLWLPLSLTLHLISSTTTPIQLQSTGCSYCCATRRMRSYGGKTAPFYFQWERWQYF
jgi:hypothetical protein